MVEDDSGALAAFADTGDVSDEEARPLNGAVLILVELVARLVGREGPLEIALTGFASMDDRLELGIGQSGEGLGLEHRAIAWRGRQYRRHGNRFHQLVGVGPGVGALDPCGPPGRVMPDRSTAEHTSECKYIMRT